MKKYITIFIAAALAMSLVGCGEKESAGVTRITYYPVFDLKGDNPMVVIVGGSYVEPGYSATMEGQDITSKVNVSGEVDGNEMGVYTVNYSAVNKDGYEYSVARTVIVANPGHIDNVYTSQTKMGSASYKGCITIITEYQPGIYMIDDMCAGHYYYGRYPGYEPTYNFHATTLFTVDPETGAMTVVGKANWQFVNSFDYANITGGYNWETGVFQYNFDGLDVTLTPVA